MMRVSGFGFLMLLGLGIFGIHGAAQGQKSAFTTDGERVYLYRNGTWSTEAGQRYDDRLQIELQQQRQSASSAERCTLIFGLRNGFSVDLQEVVLTLHFLDADEHFIQSRRVTFKNPRSGKPRFAEVQMQLVDGCRGYAQFDVVDVPTCKGSDGAKIENCFSALSILQD